MDDNQSAIVAALRAAGAIVVHLHQVGQGCPDLAIGSGTAWGFLELKNGANVPSKQRKTEDQVGWWAKNAQGGPCGMATDVESALRFLAMLRLVVV